MSTPLARHVTTALNTQTEALPRQVPNSGGGFSFPVDDWTRLDRFLILGTEGGSYAATEKKLTVDNVEAVERCCVADGPRTVRRIVEISKGGRAPKNDPALLALAVCAKRGNEPTRRLALASLNDVARIGTHLFHFAEYVKALGGGWGRGTVRAFADWYLQRGASSLAMQAVKYQSRDGWSHRDILRKAHPKTSEPNQNAVLNWMVNGWESVGPDVHPLKDLQVIWAFETAKTLTGPENLGKLCNLISGYALPHECVPNDMKQYREVWEAMLPTMGLTALVRNLGKMTAVGLLTPLSDASRLVRERLTTTEGLKAAKVHPIQLLVAHQIYGQGHGDKGSLHWSPDSTIVNALDRAFYLAFQAVEPTNKRYLQAVDVSGSMTWASSQIPGMCLTARQAAAAMALVTVNVEPDTATYAFSDQFHDFGLTARDSLSQAMARAETFRAASTDCALPMLYAAKHKIPVDVFVVYTDNDTNSNISIHPVNALKAYRQKMGRPAKLVVFGMVSNGFSIADEEDAGMLDVVGFDTAAPAILADFARG